MIRNRYRTFETSLRHTVPALGPSYVFSETVKTLRREGWLDWHLLTAIARHRAEPPQCDEPSGPTAPRYAREGPAGFA